MFCCALLCVLSGFIVVFMGKRGLVALLCLSSLFLVIVIVLWLFLTGSLVGLQCAIVVFPDHTHLTFFSKKCLELSKSMLFCATASHGSTEISKIVHTKKECAYEN